MKPGEVVAGRYLLDARLGIGGMGRRWRRAPHAGTGRGVCAQVRVLAHAASSENCAAAPRARGARLGQDRPPRRHRRLRRRRSRRGHFSGSRWSCWTGCRSRTRVPPSFPALRARLSHPDARPSRARSPPRTLLALRPPGRQAGQHLPPPAIARAASRPPRSSTLGSARWAATRTSTTPRPALVSRLAALRRPK